jgi:4-carboxymuconolactone decarboxylase
MQTRDALDDAGRAVWDAITATRTGVVTDAGTLLGPFNAWVTAPDVGGRLAELGAALRYRTTVDRRLLEVAIITVAAHWRSEFEWWAHSRMARHHGVAAEVVDAIAHEDEPPFTKDDERIVHALATELVQHGRVDAATYETARAILGDRGLVEIVTLCGYYTLVSFNLNAFEVPLPPGEARTWPDGPGR